MRGSRVRARNDTTHSSPIRRSLGGIPAFTYKIASCEKEAAETEYWLELLTEAKLITAAGLTH